MTAVDERNAEFVRTLWTTTQKRGISAALRLVDPRVEWSLYFVPGRVFDTEEFRDFLTKLEGDRELLGAHVLRLQAKGNLVMASGSFRWGSLDGGLFDFQGHWVYEFNERELVRGWSYRTLGEALVAFDSEHERSPSAFSPD